MQLKETGQLFDSFGEFKFKHANNALSFDDLDGIDKSTIKSMFKIDDSGISSFTMAQTEAKAKAVGLTDSLKDQLVAMSKDADLMAKVKTGSLTWGNALKDTSIKTTDLVDALNKSDAVSNNAKKALDAVTSGAESSDESIRKLCGQIINGADGFDDISGKMIDFGEASKKSNSMLSATKDTLKGLFASIK